MKKEYEYTEVKFESVEDVYKALLDNTILFVGTPKSPSQKVIWYRSGIFFVNNDGITFEHEKGTKLLGYFLRKKRSLVFYTRKKVFKWEHGQLHGPILCWVNPTELSGGTSQNVAFYISEVDLSGETPVFISEDGGRWDTVWPVTKEECYNGE